MATSRNCYGLITVLVVLYLVCYVRSDFASDRAECMDQLLGLGPCLTFVEGGSAKAPTQDCCTGFRQVTSKSVKCLCVLIKDRNEPELGFTVNVTQCLALPSKCDAPANVSQCPALLKLPPNSKVAKEFIQFQNILEGHAPTASGAHVKGNSSETRSSGTVGVAGTHASSGSKESSLRAVMGGGVWIWSVLIMSFLVLGSN